MSEWEVYVGHSNQSWSYYKQPIKLPLVRVNRGRRFHPDFRTVIFVFLVKPRISREIILWHTLACYQGLLFALHEILNQISLSRSVTRIFLGQEPLFSVQNALFPNQTIGMARNLQSVLVFIKFPSKIRSKPLVLAQSFSVCDYKYLLTKLETLKFSLKQ